MSILANIKGVGNCLLKSTDDKEELSFYDKENRTIKFSSKSIYEYLKSSTEDSLERYAINYFGKRTTFQELLRNINHIAKSLKYHGIEKGDIVTICMPNTKEAIEIFYAVNRIGAISDMIHPLSGREEIKSYLQSTGSKLLFLYDANLERVKDIIGDTSVQKMVLLSVAEAIPPLTKLGYILTKRPRSIKKDSKNEKIMNYRDFIAKGYLYHKSVDAKVGAKDLAIILHSGGTTGSPKGICLSNYNFNALAMQGSVNVEKVRAGDKIMTILPIFHGFGLGVCVHCPLTLKVEVILIPEYDAKRFSKIISKYRPNVLAGVPTLWESIMHSDHFEHSDFSSFKYIISGGDHLSEKMEIEFNRFLESHKAKIKISKGYGMTESTAATAYTFEDSNAIGSIGTPMIGNSFKICAPGTTEELPKGKEGEICMSGPTLMMGYWKNEEETEKILKRHADGKLWLHTGDIGFIREDGLIFFTQRLKRVIVSSGFNIYPSQIEEVILGHPKVKECCVIGIPHSHKMSVPKAYVVLNENTGFETKVKAELRILLKKHLAAYAIPKEIEFIPVLPKTLYKKVDYKTLEKENMPHEKNT